MIQGVNDVRFHIYSSARAHSNRQQAPQYNGSSCRSKRPCKGCCIDEIDTTQYSPSIVLYGASGQEARQLAGLHELLFLGIMAPVIVMLPTVTPEVYEKALQLGATDVLPKHCSAEDLQHAIRYAVARHGVSWRQDLALMRDELTGLANASAFHQYLNTALSNAIKVKEYEVGVIHVGVDGLFVNSGLGRTAGDHLLVEISRRLHQAVRDRDVVARRGDDAYPCLWSGFKIQSTSLPSVF